MELKSLLKNGAIAGVLAGIANVVVYFISKAVGAISNTMLLPDGNPLGVAPVIISSLLSGVVASLVLFALSKFSQKPIAHFKIVSVVFLLISLAGPIATPNLPTSMIVSLEIMHFVAAAVIVYHLSKTSAV